ncbi:SbcC/MukB-like Walker B domain-containing protein (plasmid) [Rossellomorea sp. AcN35-11]|nr:hypothetical protein [Rossellomorea aquimaris]WJV32051.1 SbcC/MukB-like Walker B domain-containing protein [Rossellomorea sp. AcN35-11]
MKYLKKFRQINWQFFSDETITFDKRGNFLTGENGAGKTSLIDALMVLFVGNMNKLKFNTSAHKESSDRTIKTYIRGKSGKEDRADLLLEYARNEDFSSYLVMELADSKTNESYLFGVVFNYTYSTDAEEHVFFRINSQTIQDSLFIKNDYYKTIDEFFADLTAYGYQFEKYSTIAKYHADLAQFFGRIRSDFYEVIRKGVSFSPITNLRNFIYDYILDEEPIDIVATRDSLENYQGMVEKIERVSEEIDDLTELDDQYNEMKKNKLQQAYFEHLSARSDWEKNNELLLVHDEKIEEKQIDIQKNIQHLEELKRDIRTMGERSQFLLEKKFKHKSRAQIDSLNARINELSRTTQALEIKKVNLVAKMGGEIAAHESMAEALMFIDSETSNELSSNVLYNRDAWKRNIDKSPPGIDFDLEKVAQDWDIAFSCVNKNKEGLRTELQNLQDSIVDVKNALKSLGKNQVLNENHPAVRLRSELHKKGIEAEILCNVIEIKNDKWRNAIEGYLSINKFNVLVSPVQVKEALQVYKGDRELFDGVRLVDTEKLMKNKLPLTEGSLAEEVSSDIPFAIAYVNFLMGDLMKVERVEDLNSYRKSISPDCMLYKGFVFSQISKQKYRTPYIGKEAVQRQIKQQEEKLEGLTASKSKMSNKFRQLEQIFGKQDSEKTHLYENIKNHAEEIRPLPEYYAEAKRLMDELASIDTSEIDSIEKEKVLTDRNRREKEILHDEVYEIKVNAERDLKDLQRAVGSLKEENNVLHVRLITQTEEFAQEELDWVQEEWDKTTKRLLNDMVKVSDSFKKRAAEKRNRYDERLPVLMQQQLFLKSKFGYGFNSDAESNDQYKNRLEQLKNSEIVQYKEKANECREVAERSFKEDFIAKIQERIVEAKVRFDDLNEGLKDLRFGGNQFQYKITPNPEYLDFYRMITDNNLVEGYNLFSDQFQEKHGDTITRLFDSLVDAGAGSVDSRIEEYTDYRTYLEFELKYIDEKGYDTSFSKNALSSSGGETQVPYYVAILSSFYNTYRMYSNSDNFGLVIFDESFDKMDHKNIAGIIKFINDMGFQAIMSAPPEKTYLIAPYVPTTITVFKDGFESWTENFTRREVLSREPGSRASIEPTAGQV